MSKREAKQTDSEAQADQATAEAVEEMSKAPKSQPDRDRDVLHACLSRVARLHGYADAAMPEHASDIDTAGVSSDLVPLCEWAKAVRLP